MAFSVDGRELTDYSSSVGGVLIKWIEVAFEPLPIGQPPDNVYKKRHDALECHPV